MTRFLVHLFGDFAIRAEDGGDAALKLCKGEAVLIALCLSQGAPLGRGQLLLSLWPNATDHHAKASLRKALSRVREVLGDTAILTLPGGRLQLNSDIVSTDIDRLLDALKAGQWLDAAAMAPKASVLKFWRGPTPEFEDWVSDERRAYDARVAALLVEGAATAQREGAHAEAARLAEAAFAVDPDNEAALRIGIKSLCAKGEPSRARRLFEEAGHRLREDLGVDLSDATRDTLEREVALASGDPRAEPSQKAADERPMVIISPFRPLEPGEGNEYLGIALAEELLSRLSRNKWLHIVADGMPGTYKPPNITTHADEYARSKYAVGGVYLATDRAFRLTVRVTDVHQQKEVWGERYDADLSDLMKIQNELSLRLASEIEPEVMRAEQNASMQLDEQDLKAWTQIMRARYLFWRTQFKDNQKAIFLLQEMLKRQPDDVPALATLSFAMLLNVWSFWTNVPEEALLESERAARRAVRIADQDPWTHFTLGTCLLARGDIDGAEPSLLRALELNPAFAAARGEYARLLLFKGELDRAYEEATAAVSTSPSDPHASLAMNTAGLAALLSDRKEEAMDWALKAAGANAPWFHHQLLLALCHHALGKHDIALEKFRIARKMAPNMNVEGLVRSHPFQNEVHRERYFGPLFEMERQQ